MDKEKLKEIYQIVTDITHGEIEKEAILRQAVKIYITEKINGFKGNTTTWTDKKTDEMMSDKQKGLLMKLGYTPKDSITKKEASDLIKEKIGQ